MQRLTILVNLQHVRSVAAIIYLLGLKTDMTLIKQKPTRNDGGVMTGGD